MTDSLPEDSLFKFSDWIKSSKTEIFQYEGCDTVLSNFDISQTVHRSSHGVPFKPHWVNQFNMMSCNKDLQELVATVTEILNTMPNVDYEYNSDFVWSAFFAKKSSFSHFIVSIYYDYEKPEMPFIIEWHELSKESNSFESPLKDFSNALKEITGYQVNFTFEPFPYEASDEDIQSWINDIRVMIENDFDRYALAMRLCDLSFLDGLPIKLCENGFVPILHELASSDSDNICRCAVFALHNISMTNVGKKYILDHNGLIELLCNLAVGGDYLTIAMRRHAAFCVENVSSA
jgi:hypothetical protein